MTSDPKLFLMVQDGVIVSVTSTHAALLADFQVVILDMDTQAVDEEALDTVVHDDGQVVDVLVSYTRVLPARGFVLDAEPITDLPLFAYAGLA